jgi:hypothetical protein
MKNLINKFIELNNDSIKNLVLKILIEDKFIFDYGEILKDSYTLQTTMIRREFYQLLVVFFIAINELLTKIK